jgi:small GTP-binding protein
MNIYEEAAELRERLAKLDRVEVKVALFGQPGAGKSSLINRLTGQRLAKVGVRTDTTTEAASYSYNGLTLVDLPGYDTKRFPRDRFFEQFKIKEFDLFLCVFAGKYTGADTAFFRELHQSGKVCLLVSNKAEDLWQEGETPESLQKTIEGDARQQVAEPSVKVYFVSCKTGLGMDSLQQAISAKLEPAKRERWARNAQAYSDEALAAKREACDTYIGVAAGTSALNALNPLPGVDVAVDLGILGSLFASLRSAYGLTTTRLDMAMTLPAIAPLASEVLSYASKEGLVMLLKRFATRQTAKALTKWIPFVGQAVAASLGFFITKSAGDFYNDKCFELAKRILDAELAHSGPPAA